MRLADFSGPAEVTRKIGFIAISLPVKGGGELKAVGFSKPNATDFVSAANFAWRQQFTRKVDALEAELSALAEVVERLRKPKRFPSACLLDPFLARANQALEQLPDIIPSNVLPREQQKILDQVVELRASPEALRSSAIKAFLDADLAGMKDFFDRLSPTRYRLNSVSRWQRMRTQHSSLMGSFIDRSENCQAAAGRTNSPLAATS